MSLQAQEFTGTITKEFQLAYYLYLPPEYEQSEQERWPLLIFLHGAGERGTDLTLVTKHGPVQQVGEGRDFPFLIAAPQCPENQTWDRLLPQLDLFLEELLAKYRVDVERIYLTGLSMGGFGTWHWAVHQSRAFAALVPICGGTWPLLGFPERITVLREVPIWAFHGVDDDVIPVERTEELVEVLQEVGAPIRYTTYEGVGHNSWEPAYNEPELIPWLLQHRNPNFELKRKGTFS